MLKDRSTYEIMKPEDVGLPQTELVLGKHSGRHALRQRIRDLGYHLDDDAAAEGLRRLQGPGRPQEDDLRRRHRGPGRGRSCTRGPAVWTLEAVTCNAGSGTMPSAAVVSLAQGRHASTASRHRRRPGRRRLQDHRTHHRHRVEAARLSRSRSVTVGEDAQGEAHVEVEYNGRTFTRPGGQHRHHRGQCAWRFCR